MENFFTVAREVIVLFLLIGTGSLLRIFRLVDEKAVKGLVNVLLYAITPCLIIDVFQRPFDGTELGQLATGGFLAALVHVGGILISNFTARTDNERQESVLRLATIFSNAGFMGIPLELAILGNRGVFFGIAYIAVFNIFMWSWGIRTIRGPSPDGLRSEWRAMVINPGTVGIFIGLAFFLCSIRLPTILAEPVHHFALMNTPLPMLVIGYYLWGAKLGDVVRNPKAMTAAFVRLLVCPLLVILALYPFRASLDRTMCLAMVIASSAPTGALVTMFAAKFNRDTDLAVGLVSGTTLLSVITMPAVIAIAMSVL